MEELAISLVEISEKEFFLAPQENLKITEKKINLGFSFEFKWQEQSDFIEVISTILYLYEDTKTKKLQDLIRFKTTFKFEIKDLNEIISIEKGKINVPKYVSSILIENAVSTTRGMLFYKTAGTYMNRYPIPLFNTSSFLDSKNLLKDEKKVVKKAKKITN